MWFWVLIFIIIGAVGAGMGENDETATPADPPKKETQQIEYTKYSVDTMMDELDENPLNASDKFEGKYVEITGRLATIDSSGDYINVLPQHDDWAFVGVYCRIKSDEQLDKIKEKSIDDTITVRGKITDVGEVLGYWMDIKEIA